MIVVTGHMICRTGTEDQFVDIVRHVVADTNEHEDGALVYSCSQDITDPQRFVFVEHWADRESLWAHVDTEHYKRFKSDVEPLVESMEANVHKVEKTTTV